MNQRRYKPTFDRTQRLLLPERVEDYVGENHQVRALDAYVDTLDLGSLGSSTQRPAPWRDSRRIIPGQCSSFTSRGTGGGYAAAASWRLRPEGTWK